MRTTALVSSIVLASLAAGQGGTIIRLPHNGTNVEFYERFPAISANGRYASFTGSNLLGTGGIDLIHFSDRLTKALELVSINPLNQPSNGFGHESDISDDGRFIAFESTATDIVAGDNGSDYDIFVRDRLFGITERLTLGLGGEEPNGECVEVSMSADGRYVAFFSWATNLVVGDTNDEGDVFVYDRVTDTTIRASLSETGEQSPKESYNAQLSGDGTRVVFQTRAALSAGDTNGVMDVYVRDLSNNSTIRASLTSAGTQVQDGVYSPSISDDGRYVVFSSPANNLVAGDLNGFGDVFQKDLSTGAVTLVSLSTAEIQGNAESGGRDDVSNDGRFVVFISNASNLVEDDTNNVGDVFVRDLHLGTTRRISVNNGGVQGNGWSGQAKISSNGRFSVFESMANNLVVGDTNSQMDVFYVDLATSVALESYSVMRGFLVSGTFGSLVASDDDRMTLRPGPVFSTQMAPIELIVESTSPIGDASHLEFWMESSATAATINRSIELFDFDANQYEQVALEPSTTSDSVTSVQIDEDANRFIGSSGEMRARIRFKAGGPVLSYPWSARMDQVKWFVMQ